MMVVIIRVAFMVVVMVVMVIIAPIFMAVIVVTLWAISLWDSGDLFFVVLINLFSIGILIGHLEHLVDHCWRLPIELPVELIMEIEPMDKGGNDLSLKDVWDPIPHFRETWNVAPKELSYPLVDPG